MTSIFKALNIREWATKLGEAGLLTVSTADPLQPTHVLHPPFCIRILPSVIRRLREAYDPQREIGGVLAACSAISDGIRELVVTRVYLVHNTSEDPCSSYLASPAGLRRAVGRCLQGTSGGTRYIPIKFHSHPSERGDMAEGPYSFLRAFFNLSTSPADRQNRNAWRHDGVAFHFPSALVALVNDELFIGFYGGECAPEDFQEFMAKAVVETSTPILQASIDIAGESPGWAIAIGLLWGATAVLTVLGMAFPGGLQEMFYLLHDRKQSKYFGFTKGEELIIVVPPLDVVQVRDHLAEGAPPGGRARPRPWTTCSPLNRVIKTGTVRRWSGRRSGARASRGGASRSP